MDNLDKELTNITKFNSTQKTNAQPIKLNTNEITPTNQNRV